MHYKKLRNRRKDVVDADNVEEARLKLGLSKLEFSGLMGISDNQYRICQKKGNFIAFRFYAAIHAIENVALNKAIADVIAINDLKNK